MTQLDAKFTIYSLTLIMMAIFSAVTGQIISLVLYVGGLVIMIGSQILRKLP